MNILKLYCFGMTGLILGQVFPAGGFTMPGKSAEEISAASLAGSVALATSTGGTYGAGQEPLGPSSRRTSLIFSEIMYCPLAGGPISKGPEFIEIHNAGVVFQDLSGWRLSGGIQYEFPSGYRLPAGGWAVVSSDPALLQMLYGASHVLGPFAGQLDDNGDTVQLVDGTGAIKLEVSYSADAPWPAAASGGGHSLVLARPSYGEADARAWSASEQIGGSPGQKETILANSWQRVCINEFLAHPSDPPLDYVELYNHSNVPVDLSGCWIAGDLDNAGANWVAESGRTNRFRIPAGTIIPARGFLWWDQIQLGFELNAHGGTAWLLNPDATRVLDGIRYHGQERGVSSGRSPDGASLVRRLAQPSPGAANAPRRIEAVVLNEIMYAPISGQEEDEYIEIYNRSDRAVDLGGWRLAQGVDYEFPAGSMLAAGGYGVVAKDAARLRSRYPDLSTANCWGDYRGVLRDSGETIVLSMPETQTVTHPSGEVETHRFQVALMEVTYADGGRWGYYADGGGSSLELADPEADPLLGANWADSDETHKAPWTEVEYTGLLNNGNSSSPPNRLHLGLLGAGECLVDDIQIFKVGGPNLVSNAGFESGAIGWTFNGNHSTSILQTGEAAEGSQCLRLRSQGDLDTGINSIRANLSAGLANGNTATIRARLRWLAGWPEILFRTRGNWIEFPAHLTVPGNLGTPGLPNSRRVANLGPALWDITHRPALPRANEAVVVTCRASDPQGLGALRLHYRLDPDPALTSIAMRDDGSGGDEVAGDGIYAATINGRASGSLVAFRIEATDRAAPAASSLFPKPGVILPAASPYGECLIRWGDPIPSGTFGHYHLWNTRATDTQRGNALNNTYRDCTLVYGNFRVIYNAGFRDKGSPYHGGRGDYAVTVPPDDQLLGVTDRIFASTGNGGSEGTGLRGQLSAWIGEQLGIPYLHSHYIRVYRNGAQHQNISEDLEQPNHYYAESWFPEGSDGDLHKIAVWFEFDDSNSQFQATGATLQSFLSAGALKMARYRWNWQRRPKDETANNFTNLFELVAAANDNTANYANRLMQLADMEQWMRVHAYNRILGNWDAWTFNVGQNAYAYRQPGRRWVLMPWDIDFVLGLGNGPTDPLGGGSFGGSCQDPVARRFYDEPAFRRMLWRAHQDAANGPLLPENYSPQIEARNQALRQNGVAGLTATNGIYTYINSRRTYILNQLKTHDAARFAITNNGGRDFSTTALTARLSGTAPFAIAQIEVNGTRYPVRWISQTAFELTVRLTQASNHFTLTGTDRFGRPLPGQEQSVVVTYTGAPLPPLEPVVINEIHYHPEEIGSAFIELYNPSATTPFDLSGCRLDGAGYTFPGEAVLMPGSYLVLAADRNEFGRAYGITIPVFDEFPGGLDNDGELLQLVRPGLAGQPDQVISDVRYSDQLPWPIQADGLGCSLQLIDPLQTTWRVGNWAALGTNEVNRITPGGVNGVRQALDPFPSLWINEVCPHNLSGPIDNYGEPEPFIELYNSGDDPVRLAEFYLAITYTNLTQWAFPPNLILGPKSFQVIWADGQTVQSTTEAPHTSFRLAATNGTVALVRRQGLGRQPAVIDSIDYRQMAANRAFGSYPDGQPRQRRSFFRATPGATNDPVFPRIQVVFNEFMASNTRTVFDPLDGRYEDWFELFNAGAEPVDLAGYCLTDNLANPTQFVIPPGYVIGPGQFLLIWADKDLHQNTPASVGLHVNFELAAGGEQVGLCAPDGQLVDRLSFEAQTNDISMGRFPDGVEGPFISLDTATPGEPNALAGGNRPPVIESIPDQMVMEEVPLELAIKAADPDPGQFLTFSLSGEIPTGAAIDPVSGRLTWTPAERQGPGEYRLMVQVTDSGSPARSAIKPARITVLEQNRAPVLDPIPGQSVDEGSVINVPLTAQDPDWPDNELIFSLGDGAPAGASVDPATGLLTWGPDESDGGKSFSVPVRVTDTGTPPLSDTRHVLIQVAEVNNPPAIEPMPLQMIMEDQSWTFRVPAVDPDGPSSALVYTLEDLVPDGLRIEPATGVMTWTPREEWGPGDYVILVRATENGGLGLSSTRNLGIQVLENNQPPVLQPLDDVVIEEGGQVRFTAAASDPDRPPQQLVFALDPGAPPGAVIDPNTGLFFWATPEDSGASSHEITIRVTDDGPGQLSQARSFRVQKTARWRVVLSELMHQPAQARAEYVEVYNASTNTTWDISGCRLAGSALSYVFPSNTRLAPGQALCVAKDGEAFLSAYGANANLAGAWSGDLQAGGDDIRLIRPGPPETVVDRVKFSAEAPWPAVLGGASLQLIDPNRDRSRPANWTRVTRYEGPRQLVAITNEWRYSQDGPLANSWTQPAYNDSSWPVARALFYVESSALPAPKNTPLELGQNTYYFRTRFMLPGVPTGASLVLSNIIDDGAVFYLNGREIHRQGIPEGPVDFETPGWDFRNEGQAVGNASWAGPFTLPADHLVAGTNVLAAEVHQVNAGSSDVVFGGSLNMEGENWDACTPGRPNNVMQVLPEFPALWINEVMPDPAVGWIDHQGEREPWIELFNAGSDPIRLDGYYLSDAYDQLNRWAFPKGAVLNPGQFLVLIADGEPAESRTNEWHASFRLDPNQGTVVLSRMQLGAPAVLDYVAYAQMMSGTSLASRPDGQLFHREISRQPSPGSANSVPADAPLLWASWQPGESILLSWESIPGVIYRLECKNNLNELEWRLLKEVKADSGATIYVDTPLPGLTQRYYRLIMR